MEFLYISQLDHAYCELNKRILEHDLAVAEGFDRPEITIQVRGNTVLTLKVPMAMTAADDFHKYFYIVFSEKK